jgi:uncharacterized protein (DUF2147 family)
MTLQRFAVVVLVLGATTALAADRNAVFGKWASKDSIIDVGEKDGALHAKIVAILDPLYKEGEDGPVGTPRVDLHNPDAALRSRPILGMNLVNGYQFKNGKWQGELYDPESGKTYKSQLTVDKGKLQMRGYIGTPMLGRTEVWEPVSVCTGNIAKMLANAKLPPCG